ncbi:MAG: nucleotide exchange factor GrpE [Chloroflexota bacterium]
MSTSEEKNEIEQEEHQVTDSADSAPEASETSELAEALREKDQFRALAQRAQADLVNYRRRIESEQDESRKRNQRRIVLRFADVIDQLSVALSEDNLKDADASWLEGIQAVHKNFVSALAAEGFERFESVGDEFDPRKHEALLSRPTPDYEPNTVITELSAGYMHGDEIVRPAQVEIAIAPPEGE